MPDTQETNTQRSALSGEPWAGIGKQPASGQVGLSNNAKVTDLRQLLPQTGACYTSCWDQSPCGQPGVGPTWGAGVGDRGVLSFCAKMEECGSALHSHTVHSRRLTFLSTKRS